MPFKEVTSLRKSGKLEEALSMALHDPENCPDEIWNKRAIAWVYYDYLKQYTAFADYEKHIEWLTKIKDLELKEYEKMVFDNCVIQTGKLLFSLAKEK